MNYFTGIDTHSKTSTCQHMDQDGALGLLMTVPTTPEGFDEFLDQLDEPTSVTFEAGRNWWWLYQFFSQHPKISQVNVVDARRSRVLAEALSTHSGYGRAKNDEIDGEMLALQTSLDLAPVIHVPTAEQLQWRTLCRHRFSLVTESTCLRNRIHAYAAMHGTTVTIDKLVTESHANDEFRKRVPEYIGFIVGQLLDQIQLLVQQIVQTESRLNKLLPENHSVIKLLLTAPGVGPVLARMIYTEILDIQYFKSPQYLISYSGLAPVTNESAGRKGATSLNKYCNYYLKYAFIHSAHCARTEPKYRRKYNQDIKKHGKTIAKLNLARKLAKAIYWMLTRQQPYKL